jgi:hypothetical protein
MGACKVKNDFTTDGADDLTQNSIKFIKLYASCVGLKLVHRVILKLTSNSK